MPFHEKKGVRYYQFSSLSTPSLTHAFFTRRGGVSPPPWDTLNFGGTVGDEAQRVGENHRRAFHTVGLALSSLADVWQVHGAHAIKITAPRTSRENIPQADIMVTNRPQVTLVMRFADCVPLLFYDPVQRAIGLAHAGWQGTIRKVGLATVNALRKHYGARARDMIAAIGPSIGPDHYQIGPDVIAKVKHAFPEVASSLLRAEGDAVKLDLWKANRLTLEQAGVTQIEVAEICTACNVDDWYSHRAENGKTGRFGVMIALKD